MRVNTDGIILREQNIGEKDKLVTVLTRRLGLIKAFVRGANSLKDKKHSATGLLCYSDFSVYEGKDSYIIDSAEPKEVFFNLRSDIIKLSLAQYFCEISCELAPDGEEAEDILRLLLNCLYLLANDKKNPEQLKAIFELRSACLAGYMPNLVACDFCGEFETKKMYFDIGKGLLYCENCVEYATPFELDLALVRALRHICFSSLEQLFSFSLSDENYEELSFVTERYLISHTERNYKTLEFYKGVK
jgi:DNA repair protein RecO (recombination protein O)